MVKSYEIKIPVSTATEAIKANEVGMISVLLFLKCLYVGGTIHNYKLRAKELSKACGYTKKTFNKYILQLIDKGLVREKNGMLVLASNKAICMYYAVHYNRKYKYVFTFKSFTDLKVKTCLYLRLYWTV